MSLTINVTGTAAAGSSPSGGAAQTLDLMPGEGGFAEFTVPAAGQYQMLDHHLGHAAAGAAGYIVAGAP